VEWLYKVQPHIRVALGLRLTMREPGKALWRLAGRKCSISWPEWSQGSIVSLAPRDSILEAQVA
jgi:hypothetical protein